MSVCNIRFNCPAMDVITTSIDALLQRGTNPQNENIDNAAVEAFCALVNREKDGIFIGLKLISLRIHSKNEKEVLQTLYILDTAMQKCGAGFQSEVGKFRFLNEMIKLVSPKYLGSHTPVSIKQRILQLMYLWTIDYPKEIKIKEAYEMLRKQGVIRDVPLSIRADVMPERPTKSIFQDEEKSKVLKKLLHSNNPDDLEAANRLIKHMVKEEDKRVELKCKRVSELESLQNNSKLLNEMLDSYSKGFSSTDEVDLIKELYDTCCTLHSRLSGIVAEVPKSDDISDVLNIADETTRLLKKYDLIMKYTSPSKELLDLVSPMQKPSDLLTNSQDSMDKINGHIELDELFKTPSAISTTIAQNVLKPISQGLTLNGCGSSKNNLDKPNKSKDLCDLDEITECLFKENLANPQIIVSKKLQDKTPMNLLKKQEEVKPNSGSSSLLDNSMCEISTDDETNGLNSSDDLLMDISIKNGLTTINRLNSSASSEQSSDKEESVAEQHIKLSDIRNISLENIKPSSIPPIVALDEKNGLTVTFHFCQEKPANSVQVIVVTITSKKDSAIKNVLFRGIVPKICKLKLQQPTLAELPAYNPFIPQPTITQILLISNPEQCDLSFKFIVSYNIEDETYTEIGEVGKIPNIPEVLHKEIKP